MKTFTTDVNGNKVILPKIGDKVLRDGYDYTVNEVVPHNDICIVASILLRGEGGSVEVGYYDYLLHKKKLINVHGLLMSTQEEMKFSKYVANNSIAMNTKTADERLAFVLDFQEKHLNYDKDGNLI